MTVKKLYTKKNESEMLYKITTSSPINVSVIIYKISNASIRNRGFVLGYIAYGDQGIRF